jgi:hypothetical protein
MDVDGNVGTEVMWQMCNMRNGPLKKTKNMNTGCYSCQTQITQGNKEERQTRDPPSHSLVTMRTDLS